MCSELCVVKQDVTLLNKISLASVLRRKNCAIKWRMNKLETRLFMKVKRQRCIGLRLTEHEYIELVERMKLADCKSISKYVRHRIFGDGLRKSINRRAVGEEKIATVLAAFVYEIQKIGVNYNQVVHNYNAQRQSMSSYQTERSMKQLEKLTKQLLKNVIELKDKIEA